MASSTPGPFSWPTAPGRLTLASPWRSASQERGRTQQTRATRERRAHGRAERQSGHRRAGHRARHVGIALCLVWAVHPVPGLCAQFHRPADHHHPGARHQGGPGARRCRYRLSLWHRLRGVLCAVRHSAGTARRQLAPRAAAHRGSCHLVGDDGGIGLCQERPDPGPGAHGRRDRRGDRQPFGLFADLGHVPQAHARHRSRHLFGRIVFRRRRFADDRRIHRRRLEQCLSGRRSARAGRLAGGISRGRRAGPAARRLGRDPARTGARAGRRASDAALCRALSGILPGAVPCIIPSGCRARSSRRRWRADADRRTCPRVVRSARRADPCPPASRSGRRASRFSPGRGSAA